MSSSVLSARVQKLLKKTTDVDKDERYIATSDLAQELAAIEEAAVQAANQQHQQQPGAPGSKQQAGGGGSTLDATLQLQIARTIVTLLEDSSADVQTVAVKCLAILSRRVSSEQLLSIIDKLSALIADATKGESRDIYAIGLKTMVQSVHVGSQAPVGASGAAAVAPMMSEGNSVGANMALRILSGMTNGLKSAANAGGAAEVDITATILDIVKEVCIRFGQHVGDTHETLLQALTPRLESPNDLIRKRAISTLAALVPYLSDKPFHSFVELIIAQLARHETQAATSHADPKTKQHERILLFTYLQMVSVVSTTAGARIGKYLTKIVPQLEKFLTLPGSDGAASPAKAQDDAQLIELWENSLSAFESLLLRCPQEFVPFLSSVLDRAEKFLEYDPNYIYAPEEETGSGDSGDVDMADTTTAAKSGGDDDDEDGDWGAADDNADGMEDTEEDADDSSWRVRRAAVKVLAAFIRSKSALPHDALTSASGAGGGLTSPAASAQNAHYTHLCDVLLSRFKERDQNVKIVLIQALQDLLRESGSGGGGSGAVDHTQQQHELSSSTGLSSPAHRSTPSSSLLQAKVPAIVQACLKQLRGASTSTSSNADASTVAASSTTAVAFAETKHYICALLLEVVYDTTGGLGPYLSELLPLLFSNLTAHTTKVELKLDAIVLVRACLEMHDGEVWFTRVPTLIPSLLSTLTSSFHSTPYIRYRVEVLRTAREMIGRMGEQKRSEKEGGTFQQVVTPDLLSTLYTQLLYSTLQLNDVEGALKEGTLQAVGAFFYYFGQEINAQQGGGNQALRSCMSIILGQRLTNELTRIASLRCLTKLTSAPREEGLKIYEYVFLPAGKTAPDFAGGGERRILDELTSFLRKESQTLRYETVQTLIGLVRNVEEHGAGGGGGGDGAAGLITQPQFGTLLREISVHLTDSDLNLASSILTLVSSLFSVFPHLCVQSATAEAQTDADLMLARIMTFMKSPLLQASNIALVVGVFNTVMRLNNATTGGPGGKNAHLQFQYLFDLFLSHLQQPASGSASSSSTAAPSSSANAAAASSPSYVNNMAQVVGSGLVLHIPPAEQARVIQQLLAMIQAAASTAQAEALKVFALLIIGEVGRHVYLTPLNANLNEKVFFTCFLSDSEAVRTAASIAFGHVCMGNIEHFLPALLEQLQASSQQQQQANSKGQLILTSLKELIANVAAFETDSGSVPHSADSSSMLVDTPSSPSAPVSSFRRFLPTLLPLLWARASDAEEAVRSLVSEVLGGLVVIDSARMLPEMSERMKNEQAYTRSVVITALRHSLAHQDIAHASVGGPSIDPVLLQQYLPSFLALLQDADLSVRRQAILTVNALAHSKQHAPQLLRLNFSETLLPILYHHLQPDPSLVRIVDLGPFKHRIDDGLPLRKAAYQTLDTLLDVDTPALDPISLIQHISQGLSDQDDIIILVYAMLEKCSQRHPVQLSQVLDSLPGKMMDGVKERLKLAKTAPADTAAASAAAPPSAAAGGTASTAGDASTAERAKDVLRAAVRCFQALQAMPTVTSCPQFIEFYQRVLKTQLLAKMISEMQSQG